MGRRWITGRGASWLAALLLAVQAAVLAHVDRNTTETYDEPMYLLAARSYWATGDFSFNREHPPLTKLLIGLPLHLAGLEMPPHHHMSPAAQVQFLYELNPDFQRTLRLGRLPMILLAVVLGLYVYLFGRMYGGGGAGLVALATLILLPPVTGNAPLAALDLGAATFPFIALYHLARLRQSPRPRRTLIAGVTLGLAQLAKFSSVLLLPVYAAVLVFDAARSRCWRPLGRLVALGLVAFTTMFAGYGFEMRTLESVRAHPRFQAKDPGAVFNDPLIRRVAGWFGDGPVPMISALKGIDHLKSRAQQGTFPNYFRGETRLGEGWRSFYLVSLAVKLPVGVLLALVLALVLLPFLPRPPGAEGPLLLFPVLVFLSFSWAPTQVGIRYILPVLPAAAVLVGRLVTFDAAARPRALATGGGLALMALPILLFFAFPERGPATPGLLAAVGAAVVLGVLLVVVAFRPARAALRRGAFAAALAALLAGGAVEAFAQHPRPLMFYNRFAGGPDRGWRITSLGDDWGQGVDALARLQDERGWPALDYAYYGSGQPGRHGLDFRHWRGGPTRGRVAVHVALLTRHPGTYQILEGLEPVARADTILVFEVPKTRRPR